MRKKLLKTEDIKEELIKRGFKDLKLEIALSAASCNLDADVLDPHFGTKINTDIVLAHHNDRMFIAGFDSSNQIVEIIYQDDKLSFDNTNILGTKKGNRIVSGWAFDREDSFIFGYESDGYYKENK